MKNKILIVDDNKNNLVLEKDLLEASGYEVWEAENANTAIEIASKIDFSLIIMDVRLPDMRGTEAAKIIRQDLKNSKTPVVFVTASIVDSKDEIEKIPNSAFMGKPINTRVFAQEITLFIT